MASRKINKFDAPGPFAAEYPALSYVRLNSDKTAFEGLEKIPGAHVSPGAVGDFLGAHFLIDRTQILTPGMGLSLRVLEVSEDGETVIVEHFQTQLGQLESGATIAYPIVRPGPPIENDLAYARHIRRDLDKWRDELQNQSGSLTLDADQGNCFRIGLAGNLEIPDILNATGDHGRIVIWQQDGDDHAVTFGSAFSALNDLTAETGANVRTIYDWFHRPSMGAGTIPARIELLKKGGAAGGAGGAPIIVNPGQVVGDGVPGATMSVVGFSASGATNPDTFQWEFDADGDGTGVDIVGATNATFDATSSEQGGNIRRKTTASNGSGSAEGWTPWVPISALRQPIRSYSQAVNRSRTY